MTDTKQAEVWAFEEARRIAMIKGDVAALDQLVSEALIYTHSSGGQDSKPSWLSKVASGDLRYETVAFTEPTITVIDGTALIAARMSAKVLRAGQPGNVSSLYLAVWVREPAGWRLAAVQATPVPPKA